MAVCVSRSYLNTEADDLQTCSLLWMRWSFYLLRRGINPSYPRSCELHHAINSMLAPAGACLHFQEASRMIDRIKLVGDQLCDFLGRLPSSPPQLHPQTDKKKSRAAFFIARLATQVLPVLPISPRFCVASHGLREATSLIGTALSSVAGPPAAGRRRHRHHSKTDSNRLVGGTKLIFSICVCLVAIRWQHVSQKLCKIIHHPLHLLILIKSPKLARCS